MSSVEKFYRWLEWRGRSAGGRSWWRQKTMLADPRFPVKVRSVKTIQRWLAGLEKAGLISVQRRRRQPAIIIVNSARQMTLDLGVKKPVENSSNSDTNVASCVAPMSLLNGPHKEYRKLKSLKSLKTEIDDHAGSRKTTTVPGQQRRRQPAPAPKETMKPTPINALALTISDAEYKAFCDMCFRERVCIGSREDAARLKAKFVGTVNNAPAWLQLKAFPGQNSPGLWLSKSRENVILEMTRQMNTLPEPSKSQQSMANATRRFLEGN